MLALHCELGQGELLGLKWRDVDLDDPKKGSWGILQVRRTMSETRVGRIEEETKSGEGRRIDLSPTVSDALRNHRKRQNEERLKADSRREDHRLMQLSTKGTPTNSKNLYYRSFKPMLKKAKLPDIVFHEL